MPKRNFLLSLLVLCIGLAVPRTLRAQQTLGVPLPATLAASWSDGTLVDTIVTSYGAAKSGSITLWEAQFYPALLNSDGSCPQPAGLQLKVLHPVGDGNYTVVSVGNVFDPLTLLQTRLGITTCPVYGTPGFVQDNAGAVLEFTEPVPLQISADDVIAFTVTSATSAGYALEWTSGSGFNVLKSNSAPLGATVNPSNGSFQSGYAPEILVEVASTMTLGEILPLPFPPGQDTVGTGTTTFITPFVANQGGLITNWSAQFDPQMGSTGPCEPSGVQLSVLRQTAPQTLTVESVGQVFNPLAVFQGMNLPNVNGCPYFLMYSPTSVLQFTESVPLQILAGDMIGVTFTPSSSAGSYLPFALTNSLTTRYVTGTVSVGQTIDLTSSYTGTMVTDHIWPAPAIQVQEVPGIPIQPSNPASLSQEFIINPLPDKYIEFDLDYSEASNAGTLTIPTDTVPFVSASCITPATYISMVTGTSLAPTTCYLAPGMGTDSNGNPICCAAITLTCTNAGNSTPAGDNCPTSTARNLFWANQLETPSYIGGSSTYPTSIPAGSAPTLAMGSDAWSPGNCDLTGVEADRLCPQSLLTQFKEISQDTNLRPGGTGPASNSTYVAGCCEPEWNTVATVPMWTNSTTDIPVSFTTSPPTGSYPNSWVAAPNQSITWGWEALGATPDPTYPVPDDQTVTNSAGCPQSWPSPSSQPPSFTASGNVTVPGEGPYEVHYFSTACDDQEELVFTSSTDPTKNWAAFKTAPLNVDLTSPTVSTPALSPSPVNGGYLPGQLGVTASVTCVDPVVNGVASGVVSCGKDSPPLAPTPPATSQTSSTSSGNPVTIPSTPGSYTFTLTAKDQAGNTGSGSVTYYVLKGNTKTTIISNTPNPSAPGQAVVVSFTVTGNGSPTGTVTVSASTGEACSPTTLSAGAGSCSLTFVTDGSRTLTASYSGDTNFNGSTSAPVTQTVNGPLASLSSVNFGNVYLGLPAVRTVTLTNVGNAPMSVGKVQVSGGNDPDDFIPVSLCPSTLAAGKSCQIIVLFTADSDNYSPTGVLSVVDNAYNSPQTVALNGTVINPRAGLSTYSLSFGNQTVNNTSAAKPVTLTNTGTGTTPLVLSTLTISGDFAFASGTTCVNGGTLPPTASCTINVTFTPAAKGSRSGKVVITDNALLSPQVISLSGTGTK